MDSAQKQPKIVPVGRIHDARGVARRRHGLPNHLSQPVKCTRRSGWSLRYGLFEHWPGLALFFGWDTDEFVEADRNRLAKVHRGLARVGRDLHEQMAVRQILARKTVFLRSKDNCKTAAALEFLCDDWRKRW